MSTGMPSIIITGLSGPAVRGIKWLISEGQQDLEQVDTKQHAINRARNKWAAPGQEIRLVNTNGRVRVIRQANISRQPDPIEPDNSGLFGGLF